MSQGDITSILLPASRVDFHVLDDGTAGLAQKLSADWRFARVGIQVRRTGIDEAVTQYSQSASPELVVIETNDISENFIRQLGNLAGVCAEGTDAVIIGPMNDVHLYRSLVGMGVRDYLVRPVAEGDLVKVVAGALVEKRGLSDSRLIAVLGSKGGVGATSIAQALAWISAEKLRQKTILLDAAGSAGGVGISFGLEPATSLAEAVRLGSSGSEDDMKRVIQQTGDNLSLLVCGNEPVLSDLPDADSVETLVNRLMQKYPVAVIDLSSTSSAIRKRILARASTTVLVSTPLLPAVRNARSLMNEIKSLRSGLKDLEFVVNMAGVTGGEELSVSDIKEFLEKGPSARIAFSPKVFVACEAAGKPVAAAKGGDEVLKALMPIAETAVGAGQGGAAAEAVKEGPLDLFRKVWSRK